MTLCHENEAETGRITVEKHIILRALAPTGVEARCVTVSPWCASVAPFAGYNTANFAMAKCWHLGLIWEFVPWHVGSVQGINV
jgi:hypothetical protein